MPKAPKAKKREKAAVRKGKKKRKPKKPSERWKKYDVSTAPIKRKAKFCPRCGPGIFLAETKDRLYCGRCHYTEFKGKGEIEKKKEKG